MSAKELLQGRASDTLDLLEGRPLQQEVTNEICADVIKPV